MMSMCEMKRSSGFRRTAISSEDMMNDSAMSWSDGAWRPSLLMRTTRLALAQRAASRS